MSIVRQDPPHRDLLLPRGSERRFALGSRGPLRGFLSVVVPARDEAESLPQLVKEITRAIRPLRGERDGRPRLSGFELILVDDGSNDATSQVLLQLAEDYPELRAIRLGQSVGQSAAIAIGFRAARGDWVATLDADLQNDPDDLALLWDALPGHDAALGWRASRQDVWSKRALSRLANLVRNKVLGQDIKDTGCSVRIFSREMAMRIPVFQGSHRFVGPLLLREGCDLIQIPVGHRTRTHGKSHYTLVNRSLRVLVDLVGVIWLMRRAVRYEILEIMNLPRVAIDAPASCLAQIGQLVDHFEGRQ